MRYAAIRRINTGAQHEGQHRVGHWFVPKARYNCGHWIFPHDWTEPPLRCPVCGDGEFLHSDLREPP